MQVFGFSRIRSQTNALSQIIDCGIADGCRVQDHHATPTGKEFVQLPELLSVPIAVPIIEYQDVRLAELLRAWPKPGILDNSVCALRQKLMPIRLPRRIIVLPRAVVLL